MKYWRLFCSFSRKKQIAILVLAVHFGLIGALVIHQWTFGRKPSPSKIVIRTVYSPSSPRNAAKVQKAPSPQVVSASPAKQSAPAAKVKTKSLPKPAKQSFSKASSTETAILHEIADNLKILEAKERPSSSKRELPLPRTLAKQTVAVEESAENYPNYGEALISFLQNSLTFPEQGSVKIRLEIDRFGKILFCEVLETQNTKNSEFLKSRLFELLFPCFDDFGITESTLTFTVAFKNAEKN